MVKPEDLVGIQLLDLCIREDHQGARKFQMLLKIILWFTNKPTIVKRIALQGGHRSLAQNCFGKDWKGLSRGYPNFMMWQVYCKYEK
jgi:hypothetical protein